MSVLMSIFKPKPMFDADGNLNLTSANVRILDTILIILAAEKADTIRALHLEVLRCGCFINYPDLKQTLAYLQKQGLINTPQALN